MVTNIVLDIVFVIGLHMGVAGAALATILSQALSAVLVLWVLMRTKDMHRLELRRSVLMEECSTGSSGSDFRRDCSR